MRSSSAKVIDDGLTKAHLILADYIAPGRVGAAQAMDQIRGILDDDRFVKAWAELHEECFGKALKNL